MIRRRVRGVLSALAVLLLAGATAAAAKGIETKKDPGTDFTKLHTFAWRLEKGPSPEDLDHMIRRAAESALKERGLVLVKEGEKPDLLLEYNAGLSDLLVAGFDVTVDWWGSLVAVPGSDSNVTAGIVFLLTTPADGKAVWAGWLVQRATTENAGIVLRQRAPKYTRKILERYPK